ncbi:endothelial lipase-like [Schistocerca cancellata]|uniref:endothelial lipase-like n=1 Tax=Schistocerca cancellata TaxID=274614 RepID=UPI0021175568|nr:endothelial lipase-like [Schistocerca cancellata]
MRSIPHLKRTVDTTTRQAKPIIVFEKCALSGIGRIKYQWKLQKKVRKANPNSPQNLTPVGSYVGNFVASKPTKFVIHGWKNEADEMSEIRVGWLQAGDYNVIVVDWSVYAGHWSYAQAKAAVLGVGKIVANFINWLASFGASTNDMQLAGYSLGAHVSGVAGRYITAGRLSRITGGK